MSILSKSESDEIKSEEQEKIESDGTLPLPILTSNVAESKTSKYFGKSDYTTVRTIGAPQMTFIAIGGTIGTGIFLSAGTSVATAGAGGALIAYVLVGIFVFGVIQTLGEMSSFIPVSGAFSTFGTRFVSPALGFTLGWNYAIQWMFSIPSELVAASVILGYWTQALQTWQWSLIIIIPVFFIQLINVRTYANAEYFLALIKVILIVVFIIVGLIYNWGGIHNHPGPGLSNFNDGPFFGGFAGLAQSFVYAFYSYGGIELVALAAGESAKPHINVPRAIRATFVRIVLFYVLTILVIGLNINHNDPTLFTASSDSDVSASPITIIFELAGFGAAVNLVNAVLLTAVISATNSAFYGASRMLLSLAREGKAPKVLGYVTKRGVPVPALLIVLSVSFLTFLTTIWGNGVVFTWFLNVTGISALLTWISIAIINLRFRRAYIAQGRDLADLPYRAPFSPYLALSAIILGCCMFAAEGWAATTYDDGKLAIDVVSVYIGMVLFLGLFIGYIIYHKLSPSLKNTPLFIPLLECDFETGAVWTKGGGIIMKQKELEEKEERIKLGERGKWWDWKRVRENLF